MFMVYIKVVSRDTKKGIEKERIINSDILRTQGRAGEGRYLGNVCKFGVNEVFVDAEILDEEQYQEYLKSEEDN